MALLDLQALETSEAPSASPPPGSRASKGCGGSRLSLLIC
jgi:hypothetical protein